MSMRNSNKNLDAKSNKDMENGETIIGLKYLILKDYLQDKLKSEEKMAKHFSHILNVKYLKLMRNEKRDTLRIEMINMMKMSKTILTNKDKIIQILITETENLENNANLIFSQLTSSNDKMIENLNKNLNFLKSNYENEIEKIKKSFIEDVLVIRAKNEESIKELNDHIMILESISMKEMDQEETQFRKSLDSIQSEHKDQINLLKYDSEERVKHLKMEFDQIEKSFEIELLRLKRPEILLTKAHLLDKIIQKDANKIILLEDQIKLVNENLRAYDTRFLLGDKRSFVDQKLKKFNLFLKSVKFEELTRKEKIKKLVSESNKAMEVLGSKSAKLTNILKFFEMCRKLETAEDLNELRYVNLNYNYGNERDKQWNQLLPSIIDSKIVGEEGNILRIIEQTLFMKFNDLEKKFVKINIENKSIEYINMKLKSENLYLKICAKNYFKSFNSFSNCLNIKEIKLN